MSARYLKLEAALPAYTLPDPLIASDGARICEAGVWRGQRRPELLELFRGNVYGHSPAAPARVQSSIVSVDAHALDGHAIRKEVRVGLTEESNGPTFTLLEYLPKKVQGRKLKVPMFLGLNFFGNHTIHADSGISIPGCWIPDNSITRGRPAHKLRGLQSSSWPVEFILGRGYGLATAYCGEIVPDRKDGLNHGIQKFFKASWPGAGGESSWGAIAGWAWGLSRAMDYLLQDADVDSGKVVVMGHSRLGKAALWAGAQDERFAAVISNESGCGGAALSRRRLGETVAEINASFPHWFCERFKRYAGREDLLPVDQHELIALISPRPVYVASAQLDLPADPLGEFLAAKHASPVYRLLGTGGLPVEDLPPPNLPVMGRVGYHMRKGCHGINAFDWSQFITFADMHFAMPKGAV